MRDLLSFWPARFEMFSNGFRNSLRRNRSRRRRREREGAGEKEQQEKEQAEQDMWLSLLVDSLRTNLRLCV